MPDGLAGLEVRRGRAVHSVWKALQRGTGTRVCLLVCLFLDNLFRHSND